MKKKCPELSQSLSKSISLIVLSFYRANNTWKYVERYLQNSFSVIINTIIFLLDLKDVSESKKKIHVIKLYEHTKSEKF